MSTIKNKVNERITNNYSKYLQIANNLGNKKDEPEDVLNEILLEVLELPDTKLNKIIKYIDGYIIQMLKFSFQSRTSKYQYRYNKMLTDKNISIDTVMTYKFDLIDVDEPTQCHSVGEIIKVISTKRTRLYEQFMRHILNTDDNIEISETFGCEIEDINKIKTIIYRVLDKKCNYFEREIFKQHLIDGISCAKISKKTGIPLNSLYNAYNKARKNIFDELYLLLVINQIKINSKG